MRRLRHRESEPHYMSELASYSIQAVFFALVAVVVVSRSKKTDPYQFVLIVIWLFGVIAIFAKYQESQNLFYSNDQLFHDNVIRFYLPLEGIRPSGIIGLRYLLTVPVYFVSLLGINAALTIKFVQLVSLLLIYNRSKGFIESRSLQLRYWHLPLISGPILIFMSLLSLRDLILAYFALLFMTHRNRNELAAGLIGAFLLRPHLAAALLFGYIVTFIYFKWKSKHEIFKIIFLATFSYVTGTVAYWFGAVIQKGVTLTAPEAVFTQFKISQLAANFAGLQFLGLNDAGSGLVASSTSFLLMSRFMFFDTIFIPVLFLIAILRHPDFLSKYKVLTLQSFLFFYGVVSQTTWNSTRQNIPFLACMGVLAVADIEHFRKIKARVLPKLLTATR
jgi:hypothetical protein